MRKQLAKVLLLNPSSKQTALEWRTVNYNSSKANVHLVGEIDQSKLLYWKLLLPKIIHDHKYIKCKQLSAINGEFEIGSKPRFVVLSRNNPLIVW